ncbi:N-6 DNA methylase [Nocardia asteroides]|uniref:N-6 DNA methylase n=1 Tax=Nocardia asteroides TaxID=1824 RepID=UPI001E4F724A|nr:N-6 DNA methylase [Nocardia asteroides]UGT54404.1 SAM-dependent methyltransferase [Nocardia asteroides]
MSDTSPTVAAAEIARLAGVTRATVSNWRRRHADFPAPTSGGTESRPVFDLVAVQKWLRDHGVQSVDSPVQRLRSLLRSDVVPDAVPALMGQIGDESSPVQTAVAAAVGEVGLKQTLDVLAERGLDAVPSTGVYPTDHPVAALMADLLAASATPTPRSVLDPACGSGTLLIEAARIGATVLAGQDSLPVQSARAATLLRSELPATSVDIRTGDSLLADAFPDDKFDAVITNPPYAQRDWGADQLALDMRWEYSVPPRGESELAWVQHSVAHLHPGGTAVVLLPPAVASRTSGRRIRMELLRAGVLRAVVALPAGASTPRQIGLQIWILRRPDRARPEDSILFADAARLPQRGGTPPEWQILAGRLTDAWRSFDDGDTEAAVVADLTAVVRVTDILDDDVDLTPARRVRAAVDPGNVTSSTHAAIALLGEHLAELSATAAALEEWPIGSGDSLRTATVSDLERGGAVRTVGTRTEPAASDAPVRAVLSARDLLSGREASGLTGPGVQVSAEPIREGDVLVSRIRDDHGAAQGARVAEGSDIGALPGAGVLVFRTDPDRIDPWFFAGFVGSPDNSAAMVGTTTIRLDPSRLRIPNVPLVEQKPYAEAFRRLHRLRVAAVHTADAAQRAADLIGTGLTSGALEPPVKKG